jgi:hypothetical protein
MYPYDYVPFTRNSDPRKIGPTGSTGISEGIRGGEMREDKRIGTRGETSGGETIEGSGEMSEGTIGGSGKMREGTTGGVTREGTTSMVTTTSAAEAESGSTTVTAKKADATAKAAPSSD